MDVLREDDAGVVDEDVGEFSGGRVMSFFAVFGEVTAMQPACAG